MNSANREQPILDRVDAIEGHVPVGLEVGVKAGRTSKNLLAGSSTLYLIMVDPWCGAEDGGRNWPDGYHEENQLDAIEKTSFAWNRRCIMPMTLEEAAGFLAPDMIDFAILDAEHTAEGVERHLHIIDALLLWGFIAVRHSKRPAIREGIDAFMAAAPGKFEFHQHGGVICPQKNPAAISDSEV